MRKRDFIPEFIAMLKRKLEKELTDEDSEKNMTEKAEKILQIHKEMI